MNSKRHRSAVTGEYVTAEQAKADPERTVSERVPVTREMADAAAEAFAETSQRLRSLEHAVASLSAQVQTLEAAVAALEANQQTAGPSTEVAGGCQEQDQAEDRD